LAALESDCAAAGITYRKGDNSEGSKYDFRYIPHLVIADGDGKQLYAFEATTVISAHKAGNLASTVVTKAKSFK